MTVKLPSPKSQGTELLKLHLKSSGIDFSTEHKFHPARKWRFDFVLKDKLAVEVDGGNRMVRFSPKTGKHVAVGYHTLDGDHAKGNEAVLLGWRVLRFSTQEVKAGTALDIIKRALEG